MDLVHDRGSTYPVHESGPWAWSKEGVHGPLIHVLSSPSQDCCVTFKPKNYLEILLSAHDRTSQADILHLDQKAAKCTTCKLVCGNSFSSFYKITKTVRAL